MKVKKGFLSDVSNHRENAVKIPFPCQKVQERARKYLKENSVGIFARSRKAYGRNLPSEFYINLIKNLEKKGYNPIWLGEKQSVLPCPVDHIVDFSRMPESRDLELTLAIISNLKFTVQFWTASTRLASIIGIPWILFETPDQIAGNGQEGKRIALTTDSNKKKLILAHYFNVLENQDRALKVLDEAIDEMCQNNWDDVLGLIEDEGIVNDMLKKQENWRRL
jgi:ADP-heptose:LPS heptosyltransferase